MAVLIRQVSQAARRAFIRLHDEKLVDYISALEKLTEKLTATDLGLNQDTIKQTRTFFGSQAPTSFISVEENDNFTIGIFIVRNSSRIPLHDHPEMYGMVKVLMGSVAIKSFTPLPLEGHQYVIPKEILSKIGTSQTPLLVPAKYDGTRVVTSDTNEVAILDPSTNNLHEIEALNGTAAFVDILAPPYNQMNRDCRYYAMLGTVHDKHHKMDISWLIETDNPAEFWTDSLPYQGPSPL